MLHHVGGPVNFKALRIVVTPEGEKICTTFTEAAQLHGLLESDEMYWRAMDDAVVEKSNFKQLQRYFAMVLFHCRPSSAQKFFDAYVDAMNPPISVNNPNIQPKSETIRRAEIMKNLEYYLNCLGTTCK